MTTSDRPPDPQIGPQDPTVALPTPSPLPEPYLPIGPYRLLRLIGEGGMGEVYEAEQRHPVRRTVALKLIRGGMDSREVVSRFESERQALALMNHANIARVLDAGVGDQARPYFVMEFVPGISITDYCDTHRLTVRRRLEMFVQVCQAIQHAHQKGIIHRDIKPSNVLVAEEEGKPSPKVIDFGIAKAMNEPLTDRSLVTQLGQFVGTPGYMSPEQLEASGLDIDTRTDVYALGVLLYQLLTGSLPFEPRQSGSQGFEDLRRRIREEEPPRPSSRIRVGERTARIAADRGTDIQGLARGLRGDLDWIALKALEKDRTRRYASASEFSSDVQRHLRNEAVLASPPSTIYSLGKFVRRHRAGVTAAVLVLGALTLGGVGTALGWARSLRAESRARSEAEAARQVAEFMIDSFEASEPAKARAATITAREVLDQGADRIGRRLQGQPAIQARMLDAMGRVYLKLGLYDRADTLLNRALTLQGALHGPQHADVALVQAHMGDLRLNQGRLAEARELLERALALQEKQGPDQIETGWTTYFLGTTQARMGDRSAVLLLQRAQQIFEQRLGREDVAVAWCLNDLGNVYSSEGEPEKASEYYRRALRIKEKAVGPDSYDAAITMNSLGLTLMQRGRYAEARPYFQRATHLTESILGPQHLQTAFCQFNLGEVIWRGGDPPAGMTWMNRGIRAVETIQGPHGFELGTLLYSIGVLEDERSNLQKAEDLYRRALSIRQRFAMPDDPEFATMLERTASVLRRTGRHAEASTMEDRARAIRSQRTSG